MVNLDELAQFNCLMVQCHDNPDADALACGYAIVTYFQERHKKSVRFIYGGTAAISKPNLLLMVNTFQIPAEHITSLGEKPDLLLYVDCQPGQKNVQHFDAAEYAVIDHHEISRELNLSRQDIRSNYGSCSTILWTLMKEKFDFQAHQNLATALFYGLYMDTSKLQEIVYPADRDLRDEFELTLNRPAFQSFLDSNLSVDELKTVSRALDSCVVQRAGRFGYAVVFAQPPEQDSNEFVDPNLLGVINDILIEVNGIHACIVYCLQPGGIKYSVRTCVREIRADELAGYLGYGGGHLRKAGGRIPEDWVKTENTSLKEAAYPYLHQKMESYFADEAVIDTTQFEEASQIPGQFQMKEYRKNPVPAWYVLPEDLFPEGMEEGASLTVRMMGGDFPIEPIEGVYIMIGPDEAYPIARELFHEKYQETDTVKYDGEYEPTVRSSQTGARIALIPYAKSCIPRGRPSVYGVQLIHRTKVFSEFRSIETYMLGRSGDWLLAPKSNPRDMYISTEKTFRILYG